MLPLNLFLCHIGKTKSSISSQKLKKQTDKNKAEVIEFQENKMRNLIKTKKITGLIKKILPSKLCECQV